MPAIGGLLVLLASCASPSDESRLPPPLTLPPASAAAAASEPQAASTLRIDPAPMPAALPPAKVTPPPPVANAKPVAPDEAVTLSLEQVSLANFAQLVFADVLKRNVNIDPQVLSRRDLVTFRSGAAQSAAQLELAATLLLKSYGIAVVDAGGLVRIVPDNASLGSLPEIRRGAALPDTPLPMRPIFHLVQMQAVRQTDVAAWLRTLFGDRIKSQEDAARNALLISGTPDTVAAALEAIRVLDQPVMAGGSSIAITPLYWSADDLARRLFEVLTAQGYAVQPLTAQAAGGMRYPIVLLPVSALNTMFVFAQGSQAMAQVEKWARALDKPNERGIGKNYFTYAVRHKDASALAATLEQVMGGRTTATPTASATTAGGAAAASSTSSSSGRVVVDKPTNMLIFQASQDEYSQIISLLQTLDRPTKAALIEVTVAEMSTDDANQLGVEWAFTGSGGSGGTAGGLSLGTSGFSYQLLNSADSVKVAVNALATNNRATVLSSPRLLARNGELATIQVGQEVPTITSQSTTPTSSSGSTVTQSVQYRTTGVILKVKPIIHSSDQIDLDISQEVSSIASTTTTVSITPTFSKRQVDTKLTLRNGATVMLGGLISEDLSDGRSGIPGLKDVPLLGQLFRSDTSSGSRKQLVVLITPYIINDDHDAQVLTDAFRNMLGPWASRKAAPLPQTAVPLPSAAASQPAGPASDAAGGR